MDHSNLINNCHLHLRFALMSKTIFLVNMNNNSIKHPNNPIFPPLDLSLLSLLNNPNNLKKVILINFNRKANNNIKTVIVNHIFLH